MRRGVLLGLALALPAVAGGDEVFTRSGGRVTGEIVERGQNSVVVDIGIGRVELPLSYVERIVPGEAPITVYRRRAQALAPDDLAGWLELGRWARDNDLSTQAAEAFAHVVARDPDQAEAQQALGRVNLDGRWMTREESYEARGLVRFEGGWVTPDERAAALAERAEAARRAREEAEAQARVRETEARLREAEAQARIAEAQARAQEAEARAAEVNAGAFPFPLAFGALPSFGFAAPPVFGAPPVFAGAFVARCHRPGPGRRVDNAEGKRDGGRGARVKPSSRPARRPRTAGYSR